MSTRIERESIPHNELRRLSHPIRPDYLKWRLVTSKGQSPVCAPYVAKEDLIARLDEVFGSDWECHALTTEQVIGSRVRVSVTTTISLCQGMSSWDRSEGADASGDLSEDVTKAAMTYSFRRAAFLWNVCGVQSLARLGRMFGTVAPSGSERAKIDGQWVNWQPPEIKIAGWDYITEQKHGGHAELPSICISKIEPDVGAMYKEAFGMDGDAWTEEMRKLTGDSEARQRLHRAAKEAGLRAVKGKGYINPPTKEEA